MNFQYHLPVNLIFGRGKIAEVGTLASACGRKVFLVTGKGSVKKTGLLNLICRKLEEAGLTVVLFDGVESNPLTTTAMNGARKCRAEGCDMVLAAGGGSALDCAKAIAFLSVNDGDINEYIFGQRFGDSALPLLLVPTTCGTGSEGNGFAVLTNPDTGDKKSLRSTALIPNISVVDSSLMESMPRRVLASVGFDALCHAIEAYLARTAQPISDAMALEAVELLGRHLPALFSGNATEEDWDCVTLASTIGGMVIGIAGVTLPHAMEHPVSGLKDIPHGQGLAALIPAITSISVQRAQDRAVLDKYRRISRALGGKSERDCAAQLNSILTQIDLETSLSQLGILETDIPWLTANCLKVSAASVKNHPVPFSAEDITQLYHIAY